jgi:hypothetical protein
LAEATGEFSEGKVVVTDLVENEPGDASDVEVPQNTPTPGLLLGLKGVERRSSEGVERQGSEWSQYLLTSGMTVVGGPPVKSKVLRQNTIKSDLPIIPDEEGETIKPFAYKWLDFKSRRQVLESPDPVAIKPFENNPLGVTSIDTPVIPPRSDSAPPYERLETMEILEHFAINILKEDSECLDGLSSRSIMPAAITQPSIQLPIITTLTPPQDSTQMPKLD